MNSQQMEQLFNEADRLSTVGQHKEALEAFLKLAEIGCGSAMTRLGIIYCDGLGVDIDYDESCKWDLQAIEAGEIVAMLNLALTYCRKREFREARRWLEKSVASGDGEAALELAQLLHVTDFEFENVLRALSFAINSDNITAESLEKAKAMKISLEGGRS